MIDFGLWKVRDAQRYCDLYAAAAPSREQWLAAELEATGGDPAWLETPAGLDDLWTWATTRIDTEGPTRLVLVTSQPEDDPQPGPRAPWHDQDNENPYLSNGALWMIDLLGCHLAMLAQKQLPDAHWGIYRSPARRREYKRNHTVLIGTGRGQGAGPADMVYGQVIGHVHRGEAWRADALCWLYTYLVTGEQ